MSAHAHPTRSTSFDTGPSGAFDPFTATNPLAAYRGRSVSDAFDPFTSKNPLANYSARNECATAGASDMWWHPCFADDAGPWQGPPAPQDVECVVKVHYVPVSINGSTSMQATYSSNVCSVPP
eukprot:Tamp_33087.p3 GENE.Tamp_33087~~Tamp_33087.p3  ORF type:complete len:123 (+),score=2.00 Tamp_33087:122-490(+)